MKYEICYCYYFIAFKKCIQAWLVVVTINYTITEN